MMVVQELGQLLAQAFVALGLVAEHDRPLEQSLLQRVRQITPQRRGRGTEYKKITAGIVVSADRIGSTAHDDLERPPPLEEPKLGRRLDENNAVAGKFRPIHHA